MRRRDKADEKAKRDTLAATRRPLLGARVIFAAWLVLTGVGTVFPGWRLWGLHLPAFLPIWAQIIVFGAALVLLFLPGESWRVIGSMRLLPARLIQSPLWAVVLVAAFYIFRVSVGLLGDGVVRGQETQQGAFWPSKILPGYLATLVYDVVHPVLGYSGQDAVAVLSLVAGCGFLFIIWYFPRLIWKNPKDRLTARLILTTSGVTAMFFGYIESYALPCAAMMGFIFAAEAYRRKKGSFLVAILFFVLAVVSHFAAVVLFPALVALGFAHRDQQRWPLGAVIVTGVVTGVWGYLAFYGGVFAREASTGSMLVPLIPRPPLNYGLISPAHLLDIANLFLLVCPGLLIAIPLIRSGKVMPRKVRPRFFWPLAIFIPLSIPLFLDPKLGMARDWDLLTLGLVPLLVWGAVRLADSRSARPRGALLLPAFVSVVVLMMFVGINQHVPAAIARFEKLLELDKARGGYGYEILAMWYQARGETDNEIRQWENALRLEENKRYWLNLSVAYIIKGDKQKGYQAAQRACALDTSWARGVFYMGRVFSELSMPDSALVYYSRAVALEPDDDAMRFSLGGMLGRGGQLEEAREQIEAAIRLAPDDVRYYNALARILMEGDDLSEVESVLKKALQLNPYNLQSHVNLVTLYHKTRRDTLALGELARSRLLPGLTRQQRAQIAELEKRIRAGDSLPDSTG